MSFSLSNLGSSQGWGKAFPQWIPPPPLPRLFSQEANPGAFSMCPSRQNNEALEAWDPRFLLLSRSRRGRLRGGDPGTYAGPTGRRRGGGGGQPGLMSVAEPPRGSQAAKSQVGIRWWCRGNRPLPGSPMRGGEGRRRRRSNYGCSRRVARRWRPDRGQRASGRRAWVPGLLLPPGLSCLIVYCGAGLSPSRPRPPPASVLPPSRRKKSQSVEANES